MESTSFRARLMVADCATILKRFHFLQREMVIAQAGWLPGTEHWGSKLLLPEFLWQDALISQQLRARVLELRYPERRIIPGDDQPVLDLWMSFRNAPHGIAYALGLRRAVKPALRAAFQNYLEIADRLDDAPTVRILRQAIQDIDEQIARWDETLADSKTVYPELWASAEEWAKGLQGVLQKLDLHQPSPLGLAFVPSQWGGQPFAISRLGKRDRRFPRVQFPWRDALDPKQGPGEGFELQIRQATHHVNEVWAAEMAAAVIFDLAGEAPPEFLDDSARWCFDEIRHCRMGFTRYQDWGFRMDEMPMGSFSYDAGAESDPVTRLGIIYYFESTYIHTKSERTKIFAAFGDRASSHDMDFDWADELIHSYYGTRWLKHFLDARGEKRGPNDIKKEAEACVQAIRARANDSDRQATEAAYQRTLQRARELAAVRKAA